MRWLQAWRRRERGEALAHHTHTDTDTDSHTDTGGCTTLSVLALGSHNGLFQLGNVVLARIQGEQHHCRGGQFTRPVCVPLILQSEVCRNLTQCDPTQWIVFEPSSSVLLQLPTWDLSHATLPTTCPQHSMCMNMCCSYSKEQLKPNSYLVTYFHQLLLHTLISSACSQQGSPVLPNWPGQEWTRSWSIETQRCRVPQTTSRSTPEPDHGPRPSTGGRGQGHDA